MRVGYCSELLMHARSGCRIGVALVPCVQHSFEIFVSEQREKRDAGGWLNGDSVKQNFEVTRHARDCLGLKKSSVVLELQVSLRGWINYQREIEARNS